MKDTIFILGVFLLFSRKFEKDIVNGMFGRCLAGLKEWKVRSLSKLKQSFEKMKIHLSDNGRKPDVYTTGEQFDSVSNEMTRMIMKT